METAADFLEAGFRCLLALTGLAIVLIGLGRYARIYGRASSKTFIFLLRVVENTGAFLENVSIGTVQIVLGLGRRSASAYQSASEGTRRLRASLAGAARQVASMLAEFFAGVWADMRAVGRVLKKVAAMIGQGLYWLVVPVVALGQRIQIILRWIAARLRWLGRTFIRLLQGLLIPLVALGGLASLLLSWVGLGLKKTGRSFAHFLRRLLTPVVRLGRFIGQILRASARFLLLLLQLVLQAIHQLLQQLGRQASRFGRLTLGLIVVLGRLIAVFLRLIGRGVSAVVRPVITTLRRFVIFMAAAGRFVGQLLRSFGRALWRTVLSVTHWAQRGLQKASRRTVHLLRLLLVPVIVLGQALVALLRLTGRGLKAVVKHLFAAFRRLVTFVAAAGRFVGRLLQSFGRALWQRLLSFTRWTQRGLQAMVRLVTYLLRLLLVPLIDLGRILWSWFRRIGRHVIVWARTAASIGSRFIMFLFHQLQRFFRRAFDLSAAGAAILGSAIAVVLRWLRGFLARLRALIQSILRPMGRALKSMQTHTTRSMRWLWGILAAAGRRILSMLMTVVELVLLPVIAIWRLLSSLAIATRQSVVFYAKQAAHWLARPFLWLFRRLRYGYQLLAARIAQRIGKQNVTRLSNLLLTMSVASLLYIMPTMVNRLTTVHIEIWTNDTKASWVHDVTEVFNEQKVKTRSGKTIVVHVEQRDSGDFPVDIEALLDEKKEGPTVISPGTIAWVNAADAIWRAEKGQTLVAGDCPPLAYAPIGFGMWLSMAEAMGYPDTPIGWQDIVDLAADPAGWARYGHPEWGQFKFGHTDPNSSNTGLAAMTSFTYATLGQTSGLTPELARSAEVVAAFTKLERITYHYGSSTKSLNIATAIRGKAYLHAVASSENSILATNYFQDEYLREPIVFIFPKEGAFWSENPYCVVDAPWVTADQQEAAWLYRDYLLGREAQTETVKGWLRPVKLAHLPRTLPPEWRNTDPSVTTADIPPLETDASGETTEAVQNVFNRAKKKATTILVLDTSSSMRGDKIRMAKEGMVQFLQQLDAADEVMVLRFDDSVEIVQPISPAGAIVASLSREIERLRLPLVARTSLHDAVCQAKAAAEAAKLEDEANEEQRLYGVVLLSDGEDTKSNILEAEMFANCLPQSESADVVKIFTIAYGDDAIEELLERIAERTNGRSFVADPENIEEVYAAISFEQ